MMEFFVVTFAGIATVFDIKKRQIPNKLILCMFGTWLIILCVMLSIDISRAVMILIDSGLGLLIGGGIFMSVYLISKNGLGGGDVKFMAAAGLFLGLGSTLTSILLGSTLAAITGIALIIFKKITRKDKMPLAPFLLIGILTTVFLV